MSDRHRDLKIALEYGRDELTTDIIINALRNRVLELKSDSINHQSRENLLLKGKNVGKSNFHSKFQNDPKKRNNDKMKSKTKANGKKCFWVTLQRIFTKAK